MLYFRACPKCQTGTIEHNNDPFTEYLQCLNCGFMRDIPDGADAVATLAEIRTQFEAAAEAVEAEASSAA